MGECPRPNDDELNDVITQALHDTDLQIRDENDMTGKIIRELRNERKRLIVPRNAGQVSNYDDAANATLTGDSMVDKLNDMANNPPCGHAITLLQCQATATNIRDVIVASVVGADVSTSLILATKPVCDSKILPLLRGDVGRNLISKDRVVVLMNNFFDGGTVDVAMVHGNL
ncbi:hypothetical protein GQ44DRAFT_760443 [Phaeosphaeriaceae sp. PMI808]|nr:hypothetical protein GQ44DRAFT_760443 [Phaeosphaeriaceae sp. PMI808]